MMVIPLQKGNGNDKALGKVMKQQEMRKNKIRVLMLVNWRVQYSHDIPEGIQPPDYYAEVQPYWFFRYMNPGFDVDVIDISSPRIIGKLEKQLRFYIWQTVRALPRLRRYDIVLSHGMQSGIALALWRRLFGKGGYQHIVFDIGAFNSGRRSGRALKLMQMASKSLDGVIYHTEIQREYYEACHPWLLEKSRFIRFGTDAAFFGADEEEKAHDQDEGYILSFGKIKRDWNTLFRAYEYSDQSLSLRIIGDSSLTNDNPKVEILPAVPLEQLMEQIHNAAFCVVPLEILPYSYGQMTLLQQMAMGKAVIAADVPSLLAYHEGDGVLWYEPGNAEQLSKMMNRLASSKETCKALGMRAAKLVHSTYNEVQMAGEIEDFLLERIGKVAGEAATSAEKR